MAIQSTINSIKQHLKECYDAVEEKQATLPENKNLANLPDTIKTISAGGEGDIQHEYLGCETLQEALYLQDIMPEIINMKFKGEILWD